MLGTRPGSRMMALLLKFWFHFCIYKMELIPQGLLG